LINLKGLDLSYNIIEKLDVEVFEGLQSLENLDLSNNFIKISGKYLNPVYFALAHKFSNVFMQLNKNLRLSLNNNQLKSLRNHSFVGFDNFNCLELTSNQLNEIKIDYFTNLVQLNKLYLNENQIHKLPAGWLRNLKLLTLLNLTNNLLIKLDRGCLVDSIVELYLCNNKL
jgi:Leucine-rich repeat (LRR) protein